MNVFMPEGAFKVNDVVMEKIHVDDKFLQKDNGLTFLLAAYNITNAKIRKAKASQYRNLPHGTDPHNWYYSKSEKKELAKTVMDNSIDEITIEVEYNGFFAELSWVKGVNYTVLVNNRLVEDVEDLVGEFIVALDFIYDLLFTNSEAKEV